jgi:hypothetical protein
VSAMTGYSKITAQPPANNQEERAVLRLRISQTKFQMSSSIYNGCCFTNACNPSWASLKHPGTHKAWSVWSHAVQDSKACECSHPQHSHGCIFSHLSSYRSSSSYRKLGLQQQHRNPPTAAAYTIKLAFTLARLQQSRKAC